MSYSESHPKHKMVTLTRELCEDDSALASNASWSQLQEQDALDSDPTIEKDDDIGDWLTLPV
jgi:hypothetical protein